VLGFIYEYLISNFAVNAGKKAGEFYTPHKVSMLMSEIVSWHLARRENVTIYENYLRIWIRQNRDLFESAA
jgi:type I restriction enzyme M protein